MKYITNYKRFNLLENIKKGYGTQCDIKNINIGDEIFYTGTKYFIIDKSDVSISIAKDKNEKDPKNIRMINQAQFDEKCAIPEN